MDENNPNISQELNADSRLLIVAGRYANNILRTQAHTHASSDTTAATLSWIAYELCKNPKVQSKLREEINTAVPKQGFLDVEDVANIPYLDGLINETLRLHPSVSLIHEPAILWRTSC